MALLGGPRGISTRIIAPGIGAAAIGILGGISAPVTAGRRIIPSRPAGRVVGSVGVSSDRICTGVGIIGGRHAVGCTIWPVIGYRSPVNKRRVIVSGAPDERGAG